MKHVSWAVAALTLVLASTLQSHAGDQVCVRQSHLSATAHASWRHVLTSVRACLVEKRLVSHRHDKPQRNYTAVPDCIPSDLGDAKMAELTK